MTPVIGYMKTLFIFVSLLLLAGCAGRPTLDELQSEAMVTGDWSEVEKRERLRVRSNALVGKRCSSGRILLCEEHGSGRICGCVPSSAAAGKVLGP